jgi:hypothetical protein
MTEAVNLDSREGRYGAMDELEEIREKAHIREFAMK